MKLLFAEGEKFALLAHGTAAEAGVFGLARCCSRPLLRVAVVPRQCPLPPLKRYFRIAIEMRFPPGERPGLPLRALPAAAF